MLCICVEDTSCNPYTYVVGMCLEAMCDTYVVTLCVGYMCGIYVVNMNIYLDGMSYTLLSMSWHVCLDGLTICVASVSWCYILKICVAYMS